MRWTLGIALAVLALALIALGGCTDAGDGGESDMMEGVWGYVASESEAQLEVDGSASADELVVDRVVAPDDAWLVVHLNDDGKPGERVGVQSIPEGESTNVTVELEGVEGDSVIVAVHADKGEPGEFDFDMEDPTGSPDRPYFVNEKELAQVVEVE